MPSSTQSLPTSSPFSQLRAPRAGWNERNNLCYYLQAYGVWKTSSGKAHHPNGGCLLVVPSEGHASQVQCSSCRQAQSCHATVQGHATGACQGNFAKETQELHPREHALRSRLFGPRRSVRAASSVRINFVSSAIRTATIRKWLVNDIYEAGQGLGNCFTVSFLSNSATSNSLYNFQGRASSRAQCLL